MRVEIVTCRRRRCRQRYQGQATTRNRHPRRARRPAPERRSRFTGLWRWRQLGQKRHNEQLDQYRYRKGINDTIRHLLRKHRDEQDKAITIEQFAARLAGPAQGRLTQATLHVVDLPGPALIVTRDLNEHLLKEPGVSPARPWHRSSTSWHSGGPTGNVPSLLGRLYAKRTARSWTAARQEMGAEVFASAQATRVAYRTCKSRACPSCGYRATTLLASASSGESCPTSPTFPTPTSPSRCRTCSGQSVQHNRQLLHDTTGLGGQGHRAVGPPDIRRAISKWIRR